MLEKGQEFDRVFETRIDKVSTEVLMKNPALVIEHFNRVKGKLGLRALQIDMSQVRWMNEDEIAASVNLLKENNLCEDPRQIFQAQAQGVDGDAIRQHDREEVARAMDEVIEQQVRDMEARARAVRDNAPVQTGRLFGWNNNPFARG
jgi:hypothetical protein